MQQHWGPIVAVICGFALVAFSFVSSESAVAWTDEDALRLQKSASSLHALNYGEDHDHAKNGKHAHKAGKVDREKLAAALKDVTAQKASLNRARGNSANLKQGCFVLGLVAVSAGALLAARQASESRSTDN